MPDLLWVHYRLTNLYWRTVTAAFYRPLFGHIGKRTCIRRPLMIRNSKCMHIGDNCGIRDGARLEMIHLEGSGEAPRLEIGSGTTMEQNVHIASIGRVIIGKNVTLSARTSILGATHPYEDVDAEETLGAMLDATPTFVEIGDHAFLGIDTIVMPNVRIGERCIVGANSVVTQSLPAYSVCAGSPARVIKSYNPETKTWDRVLPRS